MVVALINPFARCLDIDQTLMAGREQHSAANKLTYDVHLAQNETCRANLWSV